MMNTEPATTTPVFTLRQTKERTQVRFWTDAELLRRFQAEIEKHGVRMQDVYADFMAWFVEQSERGKIEFK